jgi:hypothetical protein
MALVWNGFSVLLVNYRGSIGFGQVSCWGLLVVLVVLLGGGVGVVGGGYGGVGGGVGVSDQCAFILWL